MKYLRPIREDVNYDEVMLQNILNIARDEGYNVVANYEPRWGSKWYSFCVGGRLWKIIIERHVDENNLHEPDDKFLPMMLNIYPRLIEVLDAEEMLVRSYGLYRKDLFREDVKDVTYIEEYISLKEDYNISGVIFRFRL